MSTQHPCVRCLMIACAALLIQCKPSDEPPRDPSQDAASRPALVNTSSHENTGTIRLVAPDRATAAGDEVTPVAPGGDAATSTADEEATKSAPSIAPEVLARA
ncbi:MAG: hypothetical protein ACPGU1_18390, partial [Myxococcota bacterium]